MGFYNEHLVYLTEEDFRSKCNAVTVYTKHYEKQINLRSHIFENEYLTSMFRGSQIFCNGVKYFVNNGFITGLFILPPNGTGLQQRAVESIPPHLIKINPNSPFKNTEEDKLKFREILNQKIQEVKSSENVEVHTGKNLLYYTIFNTEKKYTELVKISLYSLIRYFSTQVDILFITDESTKQDLLEITKDLDMVFDFLIVDKPESGIEASKYKTRIYEYSKIDDYENILFLDADTLFVGDVKNIFDIAQKYEILYTAHNANLSVEMTEFTLYHGLKFYTKEQVESIKNNRQMPFNAGQFMFKNSSHMRKHFENLNWFINHYPGEYFFEQSFMNHYFNSNLMTDSSLFNTKFMLLMQYSNQMYDKNSVVVLHFIGPALELEAKIRHIQDYKNINSLN